MSASACTRPLTTTRSASGQEPTAAALFGPATWDKSGGSEGRTLTAARDLVKRRLLVGKSIGEVTEMLGAPSASAIPADYGPDSGSAGLEYDLEEGPLFFVNFNDGVVVGATIKETAGPNEEVLRLAGDFQVQNDGKTKALSLDRRGSIFFYVDVGDRLSRGIGLWRVLSPGKIVLMASGLQNNEPDRAAAYAYSERDGVVTLTPLGGRPAFEHGGRPLRWGGWITDDPEATIELRREPK